MRVAVVRFPGSNCDQDALHSLRDDIGVQAEYVWHEDTSLESFDAVFVPGGFSYGDYLRCGAMASTAPIMAEVARFACEGKPVLGVCRGLQLINVAYGGTLHQDLDIGGLSTVTHRISDLYDEHAHDVNFVEGGWLQVIYPGMKQARVTSIHHQAVKVLGQDLIVDAWSPDGVVEAVRHPGHPFLVGVQWHPEFHLLPAEARQGLIDSGPLMEAFLQATRERADRHRKPA